MNTPALSTLFAALEATWPPARVIDAQPFRFRDGAGGGKRVSSTLAIDTFTADAIEKAEEAMQKMGQPSLFMLRPDDTGLDDILASRGYAIADPTLIYLIEPSQIARPGPSGQVLPTWPPFAIQRELWADAGIGDARLAVMDRATDPKTSILCRIRDTPAATLFLAIHDGIAMVHALEVAEPHQRKGVGETALRAAAHWALGKGANWLALAVTEANAAANALYRKLGMECAGGYHYRLAPEAGT